MKHYNHKITTKCLKDILKGKWLILTANNPHNVEHTLEENKAFNVLLRRELSRYESQVRSLTDCTGVYYGAYETSILVELRHEKITKLGVIQAAQRLAKQFNQVCVATNYALVDAHGGVEPYKNSRFTLKAKDNFTSFEVADSGIELQFKVNYSAK